MSIAAYILAISLSAYGAALARPHYGDPNGLFGCLPDEIKAKINGLSGDLCLPACGADGVSCPQDKPEGVTASPACVIDGPNGEKFCALVCTPADDFDGQCGKKASCKAATKEGLCTYDDMPKPPSSPHWVPIDSPTFEEQSVCLAVGFTADGKTGYAGAGSNNVGATVIKSVDSGKTWTVEPAKQQFNIFLDAMAKSETSAVVSGVIEQEHTVDGANFVGGPPFLTPAQDMALIPGTREFALIGENPKGNGIFISADGARFREAVIPTKILNTSVPARYGAFPSASTWFIAAGAFPESPDVKARIEADGKRRHRVTHKLTVSHEDYHIEGMQKSKSGEWEESVSLAPGPPPVNCNVDPTNCFAGAIVKTTDGGRTWSKVWENINEGDNIYNNGIHCSSESHCVAVVEGDTCRILVTRDSGTTWKETLHDADPACSLVAVRMLDDKEGWVSGGEMSNAFEGKFLHTLDGGDTWQEEDIKGLYIFSFDLISKESGYAVALTRASGVALLKYRPNPPLSPLGFRVTAEVAEA